MKREKYYQCEWCCYVGLKEQVEEHEKKCPAKDFRKKAKGNSSCFYCIHYGMRRYADKKQLNCSRGVCLDEGMPQPGTCKDFFLDYAWLYKTEEKLKLNTEFAPSFPIRQIKEEDWTEWRAPSHGKDLKYVGKKIKKNIVDEAHYKSKKALILSITALVFAIAVGIVRIFI